MSADSTQLSPLEALMEALSRNDTEKAKGVLRAEFDVNASNRVDLVTPLMFAARGGHEEIARLLLEKGANVEARNTEDHTALMYAVWGRDAGVVRLLTEWGADLDARSNAGATVLEQAENMAFSYTGESDDICQILKEAVDCRQRQAAIHQTARERQAMLLVKRRTGITLKR